MLDIRYISKDEIALEAEEFLKEKGLYDSIPIDVELLVEKQGFQVIPEPGLIPSLDVRAFTTSDWSKIYIDDGLYQNEVTTRFTLAHELGHHVLHKEFLEQILDRHRITGLESAYDRFAEISSQEYYSRLEKQSDLFAGALLVPKNHIRGLFPKALDKVMPMILESRSLGIVRSQYIDWVIDKIACLIAPEFNVDLKVVVICIYDYKLDELIP